MWGVPCTGSACSVNGPDDCNRSILVTTNKAAELDGSARIWLCTAKQTSTEALQFLAKNQQLSDVMLMGKQQTPHSSNQFCSYRSVANKPNPNRQWLAQQWSQVQKRMKWEQVWHQAKNTTVGLDLMASLEADEIGASGTR